MPILVLALCLVLLPVLLLSLLLDVLSIFLSYILLLLLLLLTYILTLDCGSLVSLTLHEQSLLFELSLFSIASDHTVLLFVDTDTIFFLFLCLGLAEFFLSEVGRGDLLLIPFLLSVLIVYVHFAVVVVYENKLVKLVSIR